MKSKEMKTVWSIDEENFKIYYVDLCELIRSEGLKVGDVVYRGISFQPDPDFIDAEDIIRCAQDRAYDEFGEDAEKYLDDVTDEEIKKLDAFLSDWLKRNSGVEFYAVKDITRCRITEKDITDENQR